MFLMQSINIFVSFVFTAFMLQRSNDLFLVIFLIIYLIIYTGAYYLNLNALKIRRKRRDA
jgi:ABC-type bacteriocin/lantibiotic exporter with double-glycine peptidase domain